MAAGNFTLVNSAILDLADGTFDWITDNHYAVLILAAHTPSVSTDATYANISANECADGDYAAQDLTGESATGGSGTVTFDANDVSFGSSVTITAKYLYVLQGTAAGKTGTDEIVGYVDLDNGGGSVSSTSGTYNIAWAGTGLWQWS